MPERRKDLRIQKKTHDYSFQRLKSQKIIGWFERDWLIPTNSALTRRWTRGLDPGRAPLSILPRSIVDGPLHRL